MSITVGWFVMVNYYDKIGLNYANLRKPDHRIAKKLNSALGSAKTVLNVGAGTGSYEPEDREVSSIEPSMEMIKQREKIGEAVFQGRAEALPFLDNSFDASMAVLTIHHWEDKQKGVREMLRVSRNKVVFLTYDPAYEGFWLFDYFPALITLDQGQMPQIDDLRKWLGKTNVSTVPIPHDCTDGFLAGYWKRPEAYLDHKVRAAMSSFWKIGDCSAGLEKLRQDLESRIWHQKYEALIDFDELDCGYRLVETN